MGRESAEGSHEGFVEIELSDAWPGEPGALYARFDESTGSWWTSTWATGRPAVSGRYRACCDGYATSPPHLGHWRGPIVTLVVSDPDGEPSEAQRDQLLAAWQDHVHASEALTRVRLAELGVREASVELRSAVQGARSAGHTWDDIGRVLGVARQTAWERFREVDPSQDTVG